MYVFQNVGLHCWKLNQSYRQSVSQTSTIRLLASSHLKKKWLYKKIRLQKNNKIRKKTNLRLFLFPPIQFASHAKSTLTSLTFSTIGSRSSFFTTQITQKSTLSWKKRNIITKSWNSTTNVTEINKKILKPICPDFKQ